MKDVLLKPLPLDPAEGRSSLPDRLARKGLQRRLKNLRWGGLTVTEPEGSSRWQGAEPGPEARITVRSPAFYRSLATRGSMGAAESYVRGEWEAEDLTELVRLLVLNRETMMSMERGLASLATLLFRLAHALRRNSRQGSLENIAAHYDLGNDFFSLFLDSTLSYSCAVFEREGMSLEEASVAKVDRLCRKLRLGPEDHLLEIGTGWGYLAVHAASRYGCRVTTTTISAEQHRAARERVRAAGLEDRVTVLQRDYRDLEGRYDKLVSVEMIEAVGHRHFDTFFRKCSELLRPEGLMALQAITIVDRHYEEMKRSVDFIQRYIFPGSCLPSLGAIQSSVQRETDLRPCHLEDITPHYPRTLRAWRERFEDRRQEVAALGFGEEFRRLWKFYLHYCEGGFLERNVGVVQMAFAKPLCRKEPLLST